MNWNRVHQGVPDNLIGHARLFAEALIKHYADGGSPQSRARSGNRGTESNFERQCQAKIGEVATALFFDLDPLVAVKWDLKPDKGSDLTLATGLRIDVKTTLPPFKLIWSNNINDLYEQKQFDVLVSVSIDPDEWSDCWLEGYIRKAEFAAEKQVADGRSVGGKLEPGTWFMDKEYLSDIKDLLPPAQLAKVAIQGDMQFQYISGAWPPGVSR